MKIVFAGLVMLVAAVSVDATGLVGGEMNHSPRSAPVCPDGQHAEFVGVVNGKATWRCVPN